MAKTTIKTNDPKAVKKVSGGKKNVSRETLKKTKKKSGKK